MHFYVNLPVDYIVKNNGEIENISNNTNQKKYKVVHIVANSIDDNVIKSLENIVKNNLVKQVVINRTKLSFSQLELKKLKILNIFLSNYKNQFDNKLQLEFLEEHTAYDYNEVKNVNDKLFQEARIIKNGFVVNSIGEKRPFSPLEKLFAIHSLVSNNEYKLNKFIDGDYTRNLYSVVQDDRRGIVCLGYANWFKALADMIDPNHKEFKVEVVGSFYPKERKEDFEYEKISDEKVFNNIYSEEEKAFHATNIVLVNDKIYKVKGVYHNDSTFDSIDSNNHKSTFLHFMWPFGGYMKENPAFIPLKVFYPSLAQAKSLSSLVLVDNAKLKMSKSYLEYLKYPKKKIYLKQKENVYKILGSQVDKAKEQHLMLGKEYKIKKPEKEEIFQEHKYKSWEEAVKDYIKVNTGEYKDNKNFISYYKHNGSLPDYNKLDEEQVRDVRIIINGENYRNARKEIIKNYQTKDVDQKKALKDFISFNNKNRETKAIKLLNNESIKSILPNIQDLYNDDIQEVLKSITNHPDVISKYILSSYFENDSLEVFRLNIDNIIANGTLQYKDVVKAREEKDRKDFKKMKENCNEVEINYDSMTRIRENVYSYLKTLPEDKLKNANFDLKRLEVESIDLW